MKRYIKPETDVVCTFAFNDITDLSGNPVNKEVGDEGMGAKGLDDWEEADDFGW
ncbi:MAG: hypothetical protein LUI08_06835 [Prevotella sp.]|nr:hypothetical protein [Prevotella sp.]